MFLYSFIIPHHNSPELLNRCLDSIPQRGDIQIIVVDDNSNENKKPQISRSDVEIIYIDADHTKGAGHARNVGLNAAKGKWLLFADCDDYYCPDFLSILDQYSDSFIDVIYFNYCHIDSKTGESIEDTRLQKTYLDYSGESDQSDYIKFFNNTPWTKMVRKDFSEKYNLYFEEVLNGNDMLYSLMVGGCCQEFIVLKDRLYTYIKNPNSLGTSKLSLDAMICRIKHACKYKYLLTYLGHSDWKPRPWWYTIVGRVLRRPSSIFKVIFRVISEWSEIYGARNEFIDIIEQHKSIGRK